MKKQYKFFSLLFILSIGCCSYNYAQTTTTFTYTGAVQTWTVPPGVTQVVVTAAGASGGLNAQTIPGCTTTCGNMADSPGNGGCVVCTLSVTPGVVLDVYVGGVGANATTTAGGAGGYNGGGAGNLGYTPYAGGGGGGASDVRVPPYGLANRLVVAGGGGGAGGNYFLPDVNYERGGNGGGLVGQAGTGDNIIGGMGSGGGGSQVAGGGPGSYIAWGTGTAGGVGVGGVAGSPSGGGGGGGGYYGGGGASWSGGGGGSSYTDAVLATGVVHTQGCNLGGNGYVTICPSPQAGTVVGPVTLCAGESATYTDPTGTAGGTWTTSNPTLATIGGGTGFLASTNPGTITVNYTVSGSCGTSVASQTLTLTPGPPPIGGVAPLCTGTSLGLADGGAGGVWHSYNSALATIDSTTGVLTGLSTGADIVTYTLPDGCYVTTSVNVVGISGSHNLCMGDSTTLAVSSPGGVWSNTDTSVASLNTATGVVSSVYIGATVISYSVPGAGCTSVWPLSVDPIAPIAGRDSACVLSTGYLTNIVGGGTWTSMFPSVATVLPDSGKVTGVTSGITTISYLLPSGCLSTVPFTVINYPPPIAGTMQACPGTSTTLTDAVGGGSWSSGNTSVATVDNAGVVTGVAADTVDIAYTIQPGCSIFTKVLVNPLPAPITGPVVICPGITDTLHDDTQGGLWTSSALSVATIVDTNGVVSSLTGGTTNIQYQLPTGCLQTQTLTVDAIPLVTVTYNSSLNTFFAEPAVYANYQWYDSLSGKIAGATSPTLAAAQNEWYYVVVTDSNGCKGASPYFYYPQSTAVPSYSNAGSIKIYPNPAGNIVYISSPVKLRAVISTVDGRDIIDQPDAQTIDISVLPDGLYMISLFDGNGVRITVQKLVKE